MQARRPSRSVLIAIAIVAMSTAGAAQQAPPRFGGSFSTLDQRQQQLIVDWVTRFIAVSGRKVEPGEFYDDVVRLSTKTTFEAITHALKTTPLTDASGNQLGDALALIEHVDTIKGKVAGAAGDRQFRMYVRLTEGAIDTLSRSREFGRRADNTIYHKGYPISFRGETGVPSIQFSIALDGRSADIDVDYRSSSFPVALFNGHLTSSNSDVRAGNNYNRHSGKWSGLQNWWQGFFGIAIPTNDDVPKDEASLALLPRIGKKPIDAMMKDFLDAWLVEGDIRAALSYVSRRSLACLADSADEAVSFDAGMAPFVLARQLKAVHDALGPHRSIEGLAVGVRLTRPSLKPVTQPHGGQFVLYSVSDEEAASFECENRRGDRSARAAKSYGNYFGATFYIKVSGAPTTVAGLWAREEGYWKIVSWQTEADDASETPDPVAPTVAAPVSLVADAALVNAVQGFLSDWLVRKNYDKAFASLSPDAYACYDLARPPNQPASTSPAEAGVRIREALGRVGLELGKVRNLSDVISAVPPVHPAARIMAHRESGVFTLSSFPNALIEATDCQSRAGGEKFNGSVPLEYGAGFVATVRLKAPAGESPVLRTLWKQQNGAWRITAYDIDTP
jgi:hypothetical protein